MFTVGPELESIFVNPNMLALIICVVMGSFNFIIMFANRGRDTFDKAGKVGIVLMCASIIFIINLLIPVHYDYIGTTKTNSNQIVKITDNGDNKKYTLKNGTSYVVYSKDTSHNYARQKHTTYTFKRTQAKLSPIRRLFSTKTVPERVKLTVTKPIK